MKVNEFVNNDLREVLDKLDRNIFLETAHLSDYSVLDNENYKKILDNINEFLPFIIEKIINDNYNFHHKLLIKTLFNFDKYNFKESVINWWVEKKHKEREEKINKILDKNK
jgi:hypothetical protein